MEDTTTTTTVPISTYSTLVNKDSSGNVIVDKPTKSLFWGLMMFMLYTLVWYISMYSMTSLRPLLIYGLIWLAVTIAFVIMIWVIYRKGNAVYIDNDKADLLDNLAGKLALIKGGATSVSSTKPSDNPEVRRNKIYTDYANRLSERTAQVQIYLDEFERRMTRWSLAISRMPQESPAEVRVANFERRRYNNIVAESGKSYRLGVKINNEIAETYTFYWQTFKNPQIPNMQMEKMFSAREESIYTQLRSLSMQLDTLVAEIETNQAVTAAIESNI